MAHTQKMLALPILSVQTELLNWKVTHPFEVEDSSTHTRLSLNISAGKDPVQHSAVIL